MSQDVPMTPELSKRSLSDDIIIKYVDDEEDNEDEDEKVRSKMKDFWDFHCKNDIVEAMTFTHNDESAAQILAAERNEVINFLPSLNKNLEILELGCGIGRFTGYLAEKGKKVVAVDFIQSCIDENRKKHEKLFNNIDYLCEDVTKLKYDDLTYDIIFVNWLMMYLSEQETKLLAKKMTNWLKNDGYLLFRESCEDRGWKNYEYEDTEDDFGDNPTFYRPHLFYTQLFCQIPELELIRIARIECYQEKKNNQYIWLFQKQIQ